MVSVTWVGGWRVKIIVSVWWEISGRWFREKVRGALLFWEAED